MALVSNHIAPLKDRLDGDLALLRTAFNQCSLSYKIFQTPLLMLNGRSCYGFSSLLKTLETKMNTTQALRRYLDNLVNNHDELDPDEEGLYIVQMSVHSRLYHTMVWHSIAPSKFV